MTFRELMTDRFGAEAVSGMEFGRPTTHSREVCPADPDSRLIWRALEALDFDCPSFGWECPGRHKDQVNALAKIKVSDLESALTECREEVRGIVAAPPSYLGLMSGRFNFLWPKEV